jgi:hypothetical protein
MRFGLSDVAEPSVNPGPLLTQILKAFFKFPALAFGTIFVPFLIFLENATNAGFQRAALLKPTAKQIDAEGTQLVWD